MRINGVRVNLEKVLERAKATNRIWKDAEGEECILDFALPSHSLKMSYFEDKEVMGCINLLWDQDLSKLWSMSDEPLQEIPLKSWLEESLKSRDIGDKYIYVFVNNNYHTQPMWIRYVEPSIDCIQVFIVNDKKDKLADIVNSEGYSKAVKEQPQRQKFSDDLMKSILGGK
jgi:hypothetical protein